MPIAEDSAGGSPVPIPTNLTTNLTGEATGSGTLDYTTGDIDIVVTVVDNGHNHILENITDVQVNNAISGQVLKYNGNVWVNGTDENAGITAIVQDLTPQLGGNLDLNNRNITGTGNIAITGTIDGRDVSADGTKLDGIESGATADQTAAQIKTAYESNANTNNFADADVSKLSGIEPGATADQTAAQIKTAYESNADTNAFTNADHTKLDGIETAADVTDTTNVVASLTAGTNVTIAADGTISATGGTSGIAHVVDDTTPQLGGNLDLNSNDITGTGNLNFTGNVTLSGTVDGRDVAADGTKLDGIEASADVTDTANVTAAGALMDSEVTNLAQVKAFDSSDYATAAQGTTADAALPKAGGTMTGDILFNDGVKAKFGASNDLQIWHNGSDSYVYDTGEGDLILRGSSNIKLQSSSGTALSTFTAAGASTLYFSAAEKLATTSTGIDVTGKAGINVSSPSAYLHIKDDTAANDDYDVQIESFRPNLVFEDISGSATDYQIFVDSNVMKFLYGDASTNTKLANEVLEINTSGIDVTGNVDISDAGTRRLNISNTTLADAGEMATFQWDNSANLTIQGRTSAGGFAANWYSIQTTDTDGRADAHVFYTDASTERMRINSTGVGIGTSAPSTKIEVNGDIGIGRVAGAYTFREVVGGSERAGMHSNASNELIFKTGAATERMRLTSSGIDVTGAIDVANGTTYTTTGDFLAKVQQNSNASGKNGLSVMNAWASPTSTIFEAAMGWNGSASGYYPVFTIDGLGKTTWKDNFGNVRATIDGSGLDVTGDITMSDASPTFVLKDTNGDATTSTPIIQFQTSTGSQLGYIGYGSGSNGILNIINSNNEDITFFTANTQRLAVQSTGIAVTGDLTVSSTIEVGSLTPNQDGAIEVGVIALGTPAISSTTDSTSLRNHIIFDNPNGAVGKINTLNSSTSYLTSSDYRLKTDVQEMTGSIDRVKALRPVNFEWVVDGTRVDGFLAHEAQEVVPEAVDGEKDAMRDQEYVESEATGDIYTPAVEATYETIQVELIPAVDATYDEDGNELTPAVDATYEEQQQELTPAIDEVIHSTDVAEPDELEEGQLWRETTEKVMATRQVPDYQGIDQSKIVPLLTSALQDAIAKIEALETRLEALES